MTKSKKKTAIKKSEYVVLVPLNTTEEGTHYPGLYEYQVRGGIFLSLAKAREHADTWCDALVALVPADGNVGSEQRRIIESQEK
jgi:hypothetical protein